MAQPKEYRIYKPKKTSGSALKLQYRFKSRREDKKYPEAMLFLEIACQTGTDSNDNASFDWAHTEEYKGSSVTMKLGLPDVGELLLVLTSKKEYAGPAPKGGNKVAPGLFHQNKNGNTILKFAKMSGGYSGYVAQLSTGKDNSYRISITEGEAIIMKILLEQFVIQHHNWSN
jgi:hypothetical protein